MRRLLLVLLLLAAPLLAQDEERDNGFLINLLEDQLSTETRKIRLSGIEGLLSSAAQVERITISDTEGIWLQIDNAQIVWSRAALLRGRVEVETLAAERVSIPRGPLPAGGPALPQAEPTPFRLPDLPVSVDLGALEIGRVVFGADLFGLEAEMEVAGNLTLAGGALDAGLEMTRLDGPGGALRLEAGFDNADARLRLDLALEEPAGGIVANALNLPGQPEVDLALAGDGPLDALELALTLDVAGARTVEGSLTLDETAADARRFEAEVRGELTPLLAPDARQFFEGETRLALVGEARESGETIIEALTVQTAVLDLSGSLETQAGGFPETIRLAGALATADGSRVTLPGGTVSLERADLDVAFGTGRTWTAEILAEAVETADLTIGEARLSVDGVLENADDPTSRAISARISAALAELDADAPEVRAALGPRITLTSRLDWQAGTPFRLGETRLSGRGLEARIEGDVDDGVFDGRVEAAIVTLTPFSGLVGRDIAGALSFAATGQVEPLARTFDLVLSGEAGDFQLGDPRLDGLLSGETTLAGRIARTADGVRATGFRLGNAQAEVTLDGVYATAATDMGLAARLSEVGLLTSDATGAVAFDLNLVSLGDDLGISGRITQPEGTIGGQPLRAAELSLDGTLAVDGTFAGQIDGAADLATERARLSAAIAISEELRLLRDLRFSFAGTVADGTIGQGGDGLVAGRVRLQSPDLSAVAALAALELEGEGAFDIILSRRRGTQRATITGTVAGLNVADIALDQARVDLDIIDLLGVPLAAGQTELAGLSVGGFGVTRAEVEAVRREDARMDLTAIAELDLGTEIALAGGIETLSDGVRIGLERLEIAQLGRVARLLAPSAVTLRGETVTLDPLALDIDGGRLTAAGGLTPDWEAALDMEALPLDIADLVAPDLGVDGRVSGTARITGAREAPDLEVSLAARDVRAAPTTALGLPPLDLDAEGRTAGAGVDLRAALRGGSDLAADLVGQVPFDLADPVSLALDLTRLDIRILDAVAGNLGLQGVVTGRADVSGPASAPVVEFDIASSGLTSEAVREAGLSAVTIGAEGRFEDDTVILSDVTAQSGGARAAVAGEVRLAREELDLAFDLALPLALANPFLARQAVQVSGTLTAGGRVAGPFRGPAINGRISAAGATLVDPLRNLRIDGIALAARLAGRELLISELSGTVAAGGQVSGSGRVGLDRGLPADLDLRLENVRFTDGEIIDTVASGEIFVTGPITAQPLVSGDIRIGTTEIAIPSSFGIREGVLLDVAHQNLPADVELTLDRAGLREEPGARPGRAGTRGVRLDIAISAPNRMFVRGRGLDAEMGGDLRVRGTTGDLAPQGQIELIRGRIGILGQRIDFTEGAITATGDVNVRLRLVAETEVDDTQITLIVQGRATDPELVLTSSPSLPEDEILALLIFRRELATLSPLQVAQLASAAATLTGQGGGGLVSQFRSGAGLSNLDVTTGDEGEVGVRAGAYLSENVYLDLEAESDGDARATINIDITRTLRGRVSVDNDGEGQVGIFYERDY